MARELTVLIMAAGRGTRMRSSLAKVLHPVCGRPMVLWVADAAERAGANRVVCITRPGEGVAERLAELNGRLEVAEQTEGEGTGAAVLAAREQIETSDTVAVLSGDHPLMSADVIEEMVQTHDREAAAATVLTTEQLDPAGYGRVIRAPDGSIERIVETKDPTAVGEDVLETREINVGTYAFNANDLLSALDEVEVTAATGERYLTNVIEVMRARGQKVAAHTTDNPDAAAGVNDRADLMDMEVAATESLIRDHARAGVTFTSPHTVTIDATVEIGEDTTIGPGVSLHGTTKIGKGSKIGPHCTITDATIGDGVTASHTVMNECVVHDGATIGPFAYLRPGAEIGEGAKVGTYVEIKNSKIGAGAKVPHLSYIGDADVGDGANLGASTITANYDGREKHRTGVGKGAKTGIHTSLVAPVTVGDDAYTGAGSVIADDVPDGALGISRPEQKNVEGYAKRTKDQEPRE
jgi:bifunctional UDP-N-acetylglucosamine pyrophosphorylase / glucosamine-1-phosphate N-acetyltransferase